MALVKSITGSYTLGFVLLAVVAAGCLAVLSSFDRPQAKRARSGGGVRRTGPAPNR
jgi:hypothetical protein